MSKNPISTISPDMTVLDIVSRFKHTETVFRQYDSLAGECICCKALFESLEAVAARYNLNLNDLICSLEKAAQQSP